MRASLFSRIIAGLLLSLGLVSLATPAYAGAPQLDTGQELSLEAPYENAQPLKSVFEDYAVYGKLLGTTPIDLYTFTPDRDGERDFSLLIRPQENAADAQPLLILVDPTTATEDRPLGLPLPSDNYHTAVVTQLNDQQRNYSEPALFTDYTVVADQHIKLQKGKKYYLVVLDPSHKVTHYAVKFGEGKAWTARDFFKNIGAWFRLKTDSYAKTTPFAFPPSALGLLIFFIGLLVLAGMWIVHETFSLLAYRSRSAAFLLVKMQTFSRYSMWGALWFIAVGGYIYFAKVGWFGLPFILGLVFIPLVLDLLYLTIFLSRDIRAIEVTKREAEIPQGLCTKLLVTFIIGLLSLGSFVTLLSMYFAR